MKPTVRSHRLTHRLDRLGSPLALRHGLVLLAIAIGIIVGAAPAVGAQETEQPKPVEVTVTEEPGVCTELGAFCQRLMDWTGNEQFSETVAWLVGTPLKIAAIALGALFVSRFARRGIRRIVAGLESDVTTNLVSDQAARRSDERARTIGTLLHSASSTVIYTIAAILMLDNLGLNIVPLLASLGVAGIALGFGAQTLIEDLISGMMLVIEDQLGVGDDVDVGVVSGTVERLTLRSTVILDSSGVRWYVPNSEIRRVANESQHKSRAKVQIGVAYDTDLPRALEALHHAAVELASEARWQEAGIEEVPMPFVAELGEHAVVVEVHVFIHAATRGSLEKALRERLVAAAATSDVMLPHERFDVWLQTEAPSVAGS
jgi:small-conductance mechanosensitive channel